MGSSVKSATEDDCVQTGHSTLNVSVSCEAVKTTLLKDVHTTASPVSGSLPQLEYASVNGSVQKSVM